MTEVSATYTIKRPAWADLPISIDLESMGLDFDAPIFAIGAVRFNPDGSALPEGCPGEFYRLINLRGQAPVDTSTLYWWLQQAPEAQAELKLSEQAQDLHIVLGEFHDWITAGRFTGISCDPLVKFNGDVWVRGDRDSAWLETLYKRVGKRDIPYHYNKVHNQRTLLEFAQHHLGMDELWAPRETPMHHALHDARYQAECIQKVLKRYPNPYHFIEPE